MTSHPPLTDTITKEQQEALERSETIHGEVFLALAVWGKETDNLESWQRRICYSVGKFKSNNKPISSKQASHAMAAYDYAIEKGFIPK